MRLLAAGIIVPHLQIGVTGKEGGSSFITSKWWLPLEDTALVMNKDFLSTEVKSPLTCWIEITFIHEGYVWNSTGLSESLGPSKTTEPSTENKRYCGNRQACQKA